MKIWSENASYWVKFYFILNIKYFLHHFTYFMHQLVFGGFFYNKGTAWFLKNMHIKLCKLQLSMYIIIKHILVYIYFYKMQQMPGKCSVIKIWVPTLQWYSYSILVYIHNRYIYNLQSLRYNTNILGKLRLVLQSLKSTKIQKKQFVKFVNAQVKIHTVNASYIS